MTVNGSKSMPDLFDESLSRLEAGISIDEILAAEPAQPYELRSLLETAEAARGFQASDPSFAALQRGRTRLLVQAEWLRREQVHRRPAWNWPRLALQLSAVLVVIAVSLTSLVAASAQSLPGDRLYSVKLAAEEVRLTASGEGGRSVLEDTLRTRRIDEVRELIRLHRSAPVVFEGVVTSITDSVWEIAGLRIAVGAETTFNGEILPGMYVEVRGRTTDDGRLIADIIYLRAYAFTGALLARSGAIWQVGAVPVLITAETQLAPDLAIGDQVVVLAQVDDAGTISARAILLGQEALPATPEIPIPGEISVTGTPEPSPTTVEAGTVTAVPDPEPDPEADPEPDPEPGDDDDDPDDDGPDDDDETEEPVDDETEEPDDDEPDETETEDSDNSGSGSGNSGSGSDGTETEDPDDD
jgi:hypothetical protein